MGDVIDFVPPRPRGRPRIYNDVPMIPGRSKVWSYTTAAKQRERSAALKKVLAWFDEVDSAGLLARPFDQEGKRRLVDRQIQLLRSQVGDEGQQELVTHRPRVLRTRADRVIAFIERFCYVPEGLKVGKLLTLEAFEKDFIRDVFDNPKGTKRAILSMAKKNGKSSVIAALVVTFLIGPEARANAQIASGAMEREQAAIIFRYAFKMVQASPILSAVVRLVPSRRQMFGLAVNTEFRALAAVAKSTHGFSPIVAILDEIGQIRGPKSEFVDAVVTSQGAYDDSMLFAISTQAAEDGDLLSLWIDSALERRDPRTVCHLYAADPDCELLDEKQWAKANPGLGTIRSRVDMADLAHNAIELPSFASTFRNLNLNQRVTTIQSAFVSRDVWNRNNRAPAPLDGLKVWGGLDLASVDDLCSLELASEDGDVHSFFWLPEDGLRDKSVRDKVPYDVWAEEGLLFTTPGPTVEYEHIAEFMRGVFDRCDVQAIAFDRQFMKFLIPWLRKAGFTDKELEKFVEFGQGFISMQPAVRSLESKLLKAQLKHGGHPVLRHCAANVVVERDAAGNRKFNKARALGRIDGMVALAMAVGAMPAADPPKKKQFRMFSLK